MGQFENLKSFLDSKYEQYNRPEFIETDPIQIPHLFSAPEDIEIAGFLASSLAWGQRTTIINKSRELILRMDNKPFDFIVHAKETEFKRLEGFCHRTFNTTDTIYFLSSLKNIYLNHGGLRGVFESGFNINHTAGDAIAHFRKIFFETDFPARTAKHVPDVYKGSAAKRINLFLRWMVRNDNRGVDFGIWKKISPSWLCIPLDVHTGNTARKLGLLGTKENNWKAVIELTGQLKFFDPLDPVKYDFSLFGSGAFETLAGWEYPAKK
jgi:uncharacterized protein (TIGR02757 family)